MAIPETPLKLSFDPDELTLDEMDILHTYSAKLFKEFVTKYGNWKPKQIGALTRKEWLSLQNDFYDKLLEVLVPKETPPS